MRYENIVKGRFIQRPNRFVAYVDIDGRQEKVHVKNTGRCRELLIPDADVYLERSSNPARSTAYDLVAVEKGGRVINMDSQAPNRVVLEWLRTRQLFPDLVSVRPETVYGSSRFDFYIETASEKIFMEVKGVTLEEEGEARFPDAPSERAVKHVEELIRARQEGYGAYVLFVIQMKGVSHLVPNVRTHMVARLWQTDTPTNLWPSIHVYNSIGAHVALCRCSLGKKRWLRNSSLTLCVSIILSTMFLKQHSMFDVLTGLGMASAMYVLVYRQDLLAHMREALRSRGNSRPQAQG